MRYLTLLKCISECQGVVHCLLELARCWYPAERFNCAGASLHPDVAAVIRLLLPNLPSNSEGDVWFCLSALAALLQPPSRGSRFPPFTVQGGEVISWGYKSCFVQLKLGEIKPCLCESLGCSALSDSSTGALQLLLYLYSTAISRLETHCKDCLGHMLLSDLFCEFLKFGIPMFVRQDSNFCSKFWLW